MLDSVLLVYNKLKGRQEENIVQLCTSDEEQEGATVIVVQSSLQSGTTSAETNEGICENWKVEAFKA